MRSLWVDCPNGETRLSTLKNNEKTPDRTEVPRASFTRCVCSDKAVTRAALVGLNLREERAHAVAERFIRIHEIGDLVARVHRGRVIFLAELAGDLR
jgi:hypothetical protein